MNKLFLSSCLVAGTAIGAGMIALPMVLCKIGPLFTILLILAIWLLMYASSLIGLELNLRAKKSLPLGELGRFYSGSGAAMIGSVSLILLIYALECAYLYGGASILQSFMKSHFAVDRSLNLIILGYGLVLGLILLKSVVTILQINRLLLMGLLSVFLTLFVGLAQKVNLGGMPLFEPLSTHLSSWTQAIPLLSTSFGFQVVLHTLTKYGDQNPVLLKRSIFWGSFIPALIYILWTLGTLSVLYSSNPAAYMALKAGQLEVGTFVEALAQTTTWPFVQMLAMILSLIAILKSSLGVGLALRDIWIEKIESFFRIQQGKGQDMFTILLTLLPPLTVALWVPHLFIKALTFAGMVSAVIATLLPCWLITRPKAQQLPLYYPSTSLKSVQMICSIFGLTIILCEVYNMISPWIHES